MLLKPTIMRIQSCLRFYLLLNPFRLWDQEIRILNKPKLDKFSSIGNKNIQVKKIFIEYKLVITDY